MDNKEILEVKEVNDIAPKGKELGIGLLLGIGYLTIFPLIVMVILLMFIEVPDPYVWGQDGEYNILSAVAQLIAGAGVVVGMYFISKPLFKKLFKSFNGATFKQALKYAFIAYVCVYIANVIDLTFFGESMVNANQQAVTGLLFDSPIVGCLMTMVLAPVVEELIFRFYVFKGLARKNIYLAYIVTALGFAAIHLIASVGTPFFLQDLRSMPVYTVAGLVFCYAYHKTENIGVNIGAHMLYNTLATVLIFLVPMTNAVEIVDVKQTTTSITITVDENEEMMVDVRRMDIYVYDTYNPNVDENKLPGIGSVTMNGETATFSNLTPNTHYIIIITYDMNNEMYGEVGEKKTYIDLYTLV